MSVWVPELDMLYVLVPRTGSTAFRHYLILRYNAVDLTSADAVQAGLVRADNMLSKHSDIPELSLAFRPPVPRRRIVKVAGVRDPADSLFSSWWKHAYTYPALLERIEELPESRQEFLRSDAVAERIATVGQLSFSDWVMEVCKWITRSHAMPTSRPDQFGRAVASFVDLRLRRVKKNAAAPARSQDLWYEGADEYLRAEDCNADWARACRERGWSHRGEIPIFNQADGRPPDYAPYLTEEAAEVLRRCFKRMIARFGYSIRSQSSD